MIGKAVGRPSFIMCGNNITYEPSFENPLTKKELNRIGIDDKCGVSTVSAFGRTSINSIKKS